MAVVLGASVLDNGLVVLNTNATAIHVCSQQPTTYPEATSTYTVGNKVLGAGNVFGAPADDGTTGRKVTSVPIVNGSVTGAGTPAYWAAVDATLLLASGELTGGVSVSAGLFNLSPITVIQPYTV